MGREITYLEAINEGLREEMERDPGVILLGEDIGKFGGAIKVVAPGTVRDAKGLIKAAIRDEDPVIFLEHKFLYRRMKDILPDGEILTPIGKANVARRGDSLTIVTYGAMLTRCLDAAGAL